MNSLLNIVVIAVVLLTVHVSSQNLGWKDPLLNGHCGPQHGYAACRPDQCCSEWGACGSNSNYCNSASLWVGPLVKAPRIVKTTGADAPSNKPYLERIPLGVTLPGHPEAQRSQKKNDGSASILSSMSVWTGASSHFEALGVEPFVPALNWCGRHKVVALTFDDGPITGGYTSSVLDDLASLNIQATFFLSPHAPSHTDHRKFWGQCSLVKRMINEGHTVAGHSMKHDDLTSLSNWEIKQEIDEYNAWFESCMGYYPKLQAIRPPFGELNAEKRAFINSLGVTVVTWNADSQDWQGGDTDQLYGNTIKQFEAFEDHSSLIVLHHDGHYTWGHGRGALQRYLSYFQNRGYDFVNLDKCIRLCTSTNDCKMERAPWPGVYEN